MNNKRILFPFLLLILLQAHAFANYVSDGYTDKRSYNPGDTVRFYINGLGIFNNCQINVVDINNLVSDHITTNVNPQVATGLHPWEDGFNYALTATYVIPTTLRSGVYSLESKVFFIVKSATKNADITLIYPTNTEEAYSNLGSKSLYDYNSSNGRAHIVSFHRPYNAWMIQSVRGFSTAYLQWLYGLNAYSIQMIADVDMDDQTEFQSSKILVVVGHSEYWTRDARLNFDAFVNAGKDAVILSGNTMWWQVRYSPDHSQLICYKDTVLDPEPDPTLKTYTWPTASLQYSVMNSIGVDWPHGCYGNQASYHGYYGFNILAPSSPLLTGTNLGLHSIMDCQANEDDATLIAGFQTNGDPIIDQTQLGFCQLELIAYDFGESVYYPNNPQRGYETFIAFRKNSTTGNIINVGNSNWCSYNTGSSTGGFGGVDVARIKTISQNMLDLLLAHANIYSSTTNSCVPLTVNPTDQASFCKVFPNPTSGNLFIQSNSFSENNTSLEIFDMVGQIVKTKSLLSANEQMVDLSDLSDGTYFYMIKTENEIVFTGKIILAR